MYRSLRASKRRGEWVELKFMARAHAHGLTVSKPWGDSARYDLVVERRGQFRRVQVKSTMHEIRNRRTPRGIYMCNTRGACRRTYSARDVDFFALFVIPLDLWYIVPLRDLPRTTSAMFLDTTRPGNKYFRYLEAWHLLRQ